MANEELGLEVAVDGFRRFMSQMDDMDRAIGRTEQGWGGMGRMADVATVALGNLAARGIEVVLDGLVRMGEGLVAVTADSVNLAADFQSQVAVLGIAARDSGLSFDQLHDAALRVGGDTQLVGVSATGAADAMTGLYKAGLDTTVIFGDLQGYMAGTAELGGALRAAIDLAAASELDMVQTSDLAAVALSTFGSNLETTEEQAQFVNDALNNFVQAADASVADVGDLADALVNVGPTAAAFGFSIEETNAALAILSTRGIKGAEAGTALKSMMTNLMRPTDQVTGALDELGVSLYDADGSMRNLPQIIADLEGALMGVSEVTVVAGGRTAVQNDQLALARTAYQQATDALYKHNAGIRVLSDEQLSKYVTQQSAANAEIERLEAVTGTATTQLRELTEQQRLEYIQTIAGSYGQNAMNALLGEGAEGWAEMAEAIEDAATIQEQAAARSATYQGQVEAMEGAMESLKIGIGEKFLPVLTELVQGFSGFIEEHGPQIEAVFGRIGEFLSETLPPIFEGIVNFFVNDVPLGIETATGFWDGTLLPALENGRAFIQENILPVLTQFAEWFQLLLPLAIQVATDYWNNYLLPVIDALAQQWEEKLKPALAALWSWLQEVIPPAIEYLAGVWNDYLAPALAAVGGFLSGTLIPILGTLVSWLIEHVPVAIETYVGFWLNTMKPAMDEVWAFISTNIIPIFKTVWEWLQTNIPQAIEVVAGFWKETLLPAIEAVWSFMNESLFPLLQSVSDFLDAAFSLAITAVAGVWQNVLQPALEGVWEFVEKNLLPVLETLGGYIKETLGPIMDTFKANTVDALERSIGYVQEKFRLLIERIQGMTDALKNIDLPDWMKPGSPPPLYYALNDISRAMGHLSSVELPRLKVGLDMPPMAGMMASVSPLAPQKVGNNGTNITQDNRQFNLTTQSTTQPGGLALEFAFMESASR
ncbi:MAG: phage tail tape measure protein [Chloroflexota bacterium]